MARKFSIKALQLDKVGRSQVERIIAHALKGQLQASGIENLDRIADTVRLLEQPDRQSVRISITDRVALETEFGTLSKPARPWVHAMLLQAKQPIAATFTNALKSKK